MPSKPELRTVGSTEPPNEPPSPPPPGGVGRTLAKLALMPFKLVLLISTLLICGALGIVAASLAIIGVGASIMVLLGGLIATVVVALILLIVGVAAAVVCGLIAATIMIAFDSITGSTLFPDAKKKIEVAITTS